MKGVCAVLFLRVEFHLKLIVGIPRISVLVLLSSCFMKYISGSRYGPGVSSRASQGLHTHDSASLSHHVTLSPIDSENLVCCFVLLYRYWGLATVLGFPQKRAKEHVPFLLSTKWIGNLNVLPRCRALSPLREPGVARSSSCTSATSLALVYKSPPLALNRDALGSNLP